MIDYEWFILYLFAVQLRSIAGPRAAADKGPFGIAQGRLGVAQSFGDAPQAFTEA